MKNYKKNQKNNNLNTKSRCIDLTKDYILTYQYPIWIEVKFLFFYVL